MTITRMTRVPMRINQIQNGIGPAVSVRSAEPQIPQN
jgi:hypothetical protein